MLLFLRLYTTPSCFFGRAILHLLFELRAEGLQIRLQKSDVAAHDAEVGNLLSLYPNIYRLRADAKKASGLFDGHGQVRVAYPRLMGRQDVGLCSHLSPLVPLR